MQASDIPDDLLVAAVRSCRSPLSGWAYRGDVEAEVSRLMGREVPWKVTLAKARKLIRRGVLGGCACGCRGDWTVTN